ncbi:MAG: hypothetical protein MMC33_009282 [Icmadophila ericetorum]|nr:hypothetical protein [Icmadophila ericetorum]
MGSKYASLVRGCLNCLEEGFAGMNCFLSRFHGRWESEGDSFIRTIREELLYEDGHEVKDALIVQDSPELSISPGPTIPVEFSPSLPSPVVTVVGVSSSRSSGSSVVDSILAENRTVMEREREREKYQNSLAGAIDPDALAERLANLDVVAVAVRYSVSE